MNSIKAIIAAAAVCLSLACVSPRLGFPVDKVKTPVEVTLFSTIAKKGVVNVKLDMISAEGWKLSYNKKYEEMLAQVSLIAHQIQLDEMLLESAAKSTDLFTLGSTDVLNAEVQSRKAVEGQKDFPGYDFSPYKEMIHTTYVLSLVVDEWGFLIKHKKEDSGPYMVFVMSLTNKETNETLWTRKEEYRIPILTPHKFTDSGNIDLKDIEEVYPQLIKKAVGHFFFWLNKK